MLNKGLLGSFNGFAKLDELAYILLVQAMVIAQTLLLDAGRRGEQDTFLFLLCTLAQQTDGNGKHR